MRATGQPRGRWLLWCVALALAFALPTRSARAARGGWLTLTSKRAAYELLSGLQYRSFRVNVGGEDLNTPVAMVFGERLGAGFTGFVLRPKFLSFDLGGNVLLMQQMDWDSRGIVGASNDMNYEYKGATTIKADSNLPMRLVANRNTDIVRRDFVANYELTKSLHGVNWGWRNDYVPFSMALARVANQYGEEGARFGNDTFIQGSFDAEHEVGRHDTTFEYRYFDYANRSFDELDYATHDALLRHAWRSDPCQIMRFQSDSFLRYTSRKGDDTRDELRGQIQETAYWTPRLQSSVAYRYANQQFDDARSIQHQGNLDTRYQLYRSLHLGAQGRIAAIALPTGDRFLRQVGGDVSYAKDLGRFAHMRHTYRFLGSWEDGDLLSGTQQVINEAHALTGQEPAILENEQVDMASVIVLDATTLQEYRRGLDYFLFTLGSRTSINRLPGSMIPDGSTVLVTYKYELPPNRGRTATDHSYAGRFQATIWRDFFLFAEVSERWNQSTTEDEGVRPGRFEMLAAGITGSMSLWNLTAEARRLTAMGFQTSEFLAAAAARFQIGVVNSTTGVRILHQIFPIESRTNYEAFSEGQVTTATMWTAGWRARGLAQVAPNDTRETIDGELFAQWRRRAIRLRMDYRAQFIFVDGLQSQNHRILVSVGRPL